MHFTFLLLLLLALPLWAEQLVFDKQTTADKTHFKYSWKDANDNKLDLEFDYTNKMLFSHFRNFKGYQVQRAKGKILQELEKAASKLDRKQVEIQFIERNDGIDYRLSGKDQAFLNQVQTGLEQISANTEAEFLRQNYYNVLTDQFGRTGIKPDHVRIARESVEDFAPISAAILEKYPNLRVRQMVEFVLGFVQSIPYSTLESRRESNGAGFSPPLRLLSNNQGDCDSKVTLMAALLNAIYPRMKMVIIYLPEHALLGLQLGHRENDVHIKLEGRNFLLAEPVGPRLLPLAQIAESSEFHINGKQFSYEMF